MASSFAYIMRVSNPSLMGEDFASVRVDEIDNIGLLKERVCQKFDWGVPSSVTFFRIPGGRDQAEAIRCNPSLAASILDGTSLSPFDSLADAGIVSGSCLLARVVAGSGFYNIPGRRALRGRTVGGSSSLPSVSEAVGPTFEHEAREVLSKTCARGSRA